mmetsp:Transcript_34833/g.87619  ORF Transcript_34833/g.87619 Transcript_34833/m.87619 type:complete len:205 (+) Transcript_34833:2014-2628(+)
MVAPEEGRHTAGHASAHRVFLGVAHVGAPVAHVRRLCGHDRRERRHGPAVRQQPPAGRRVAVPANHARAGHGGLPQEQGPVQPAAAEHVVLHDPQRVGLAQRACAAQDLGPVQRGRAVRHAGPQRGHHQRGWRQHAQRRERRHGHTAHRVRAREVCRHRHGARAVPCYRQADTRQPLPRPVHHRRVQQLRWAVHPAALGHRGVL